MIAMGVLDGILGWLRVCVRVCVGGGEGWWCVYMHACVFEEVGSLSHSLI